MLTWDDCVALSDLSEEEIAALAAHEHYPATIAAELGYYLMQTADGQMRIKSMIRDDIAEALREGDLYRAALLKNVLRHFIEIHPPTTN